MNVLLLLLVFFCLSTPAALSSLIATYRSMLNSKSRKTRNAARISPPQRCWMLASLTAGLSAQKSKRADDDDDENMKYP